MLKVKHDDKSTRHPTAACKAVLLRLRAVGCNIPGPDDAWRIKRTHAGRIQKAAGAWSWFLWSADRDQAGYEMTRYSGMIGGFYPALLCAKEGATLTDDCGTGTKSLDPP